MSALAPIQQLAAAPQIIKSCSCGARYTRSEWRRLRHVGRMYGRPAGLDDDLELRDCASCASTIAIAVPPRSLPSAATICRWTVGAFLAALAAAVVAGALG